MADEEGEDQALSAGGWDPGDEDKDEGQVAFDALASRFDQCLFVGFKDGGNVQIGRVPPRANFAMYKTNDDEIVIGLATKALELLLGDNADARIAAMIDALADRMVDSALGESVDPLPAVLRQLPKRGGFDA